MDKLTETTIAALAYDRDRWKQRAESLEAEIERLKAGHDNPTLLTLEELSYMHGQPVYIVETGKFSGRSWAILDDDTPVDFGRQDVNFENGDCYATYTYGKTWFAYDRPPKEDDHE